MEESAKCLACGNREFKITKQRVICTECHRSTWFGKVKKGEEHLAAKASDVFHLLTDNY